MDTLTLHNFEKMIDSVILKRGAAYLKSGAVNDLEEIDEGEWCALVEGTEVYEVRVSLDGEAIAESRCDCPYDHGPVCKHEVAVYLAIRERLSPDSAAPETSASKRAVKPGKKAASSPRKKTVAQKVDGIIVKLASDDLKAFVREFAIKDRLFRSALLARSADLEGEMSVEEWREIVRAPISAAAKGGFIDYRSMPEAMPGVDDAMRKAEALVGAKHPGQAVVICQVVLEEMVRLVGMADDSDGYIGSAIERAFKLLALCSPMLDHAQAADLFNYCLRESAHRRYEGWDDWRWGLLDIAAGLASDESREQALFKAIDGIAGREHESEWFRDYALRRAADLKMRYFRTRGDETRLDDFIRSNLEISSIREEAIRRAVDARDFPKAKKLALDGVEVAQRKRHRGDQNDFTERLLDIAVMEKNHDDIRLYARGLFIDSGDFSFYDILKKSFPPAEWSAPLASLIKELDRKGDWSRSGLLPGIYIRESMWNDLLAYIRNRNHLSFEILEKYHRHLAGRFPSELYDLYERVVREILDHNTGRPHYQRAAQALRRMKKLGRTKDVRLLVEDLRARYKNRPALLDELRAI